MSEKSEFIIQVKEFRKVDEMNKWLKNTGIIPRDIKVVASEYLMHYIVVYEVTKK